MSLLLHGGAEITDRRTVPPWSPPVLVMGTFVPALRRSPDHPHVYRLRYRARGWNGDGSDPIDDARWAIGQLRQRHPGSPLVLVGHSMGGRVGAVLLAEPSVIGLVALAPWLPGTDPLPDLAGRRVAILHGTGDRAIDPEQSHRWADGANSVRPGRVSYRQLPGAGHAMVRRWTRWRRMAAAAHHEIVRAAGDSGVDTSG